MFLQDMSDHGFPRPPILCSSQKCLSFLLSIWFPVLPSINTISLDSLLTVSPTPSNTFAFDSRLNVKFFKFFVLIRCPRNLKSLFLILTFLLIFIFLKTSLQPKPKKRVTTLIRLEFFITVLTWILLFGPQRTFILEAILHKWHCFCWGLKEIYLYVCAPMEKGHQSLWWLYRK